MPGRRIRRVYLFMQISPIHRRLVALAILVAAVSPAFAADGYRIVHTYSHDPQAYTQGLLYENGYFYESTGLRGRSSLRMEDLETGRVLQRTDVPDKYFAEGLASWGSTLIQLTWQSHVAFVYDRFSFRLLHTFSYPGEGWGLTENGKDLIMSDGTATLRFRRSGHIPRGSQHRGQRPRFRGDAIE